MLHAKEECWYPTQRNKHKIEQATEYKACQPEIQSFSLTNKPHHCKAFENAIYQKLDINPREIFLLYWLYLLQYFMHYAKSRIKLIDWKLCFSSANL